MARFVIEEVLNGTRAAITLDDGAEHVCVFNGPLTDDVLRALIGAAARFLGGRYQPFEIASPLHAGHPERFDATRREGE